MTIKRALLSVSDKTHLLELATALAALNIELLATGGTAQLLKTHHIPMTEVSSHTGFPEIMDGRVKTLHPKIHGGILARRGLDDDTLDEHHIAPIDLVIVNLYPFEKTIAQAGTTLATAIEQIDIGGPSMLRSAAKNHEYVTVVVDPNDYQRVLAEIQATGDTTLITRRELAVKVFTRTAQYDATIANYLEKQYLFGESTPDQHLPTVYAPIFTKTIDLRYGENPQQAAGFYTSELSTTPNGTLGAATLLQGKALSYNNMVDADAALACMQALNPQQPGCVIIKHASPCGVAQGATLLQAYQKALQGDPTSAFGGIIALNQTLDLETAEAIGQLFAEVVVAPSIAPEAISFLSAKKNLRVLACGHLNHNQPLSLQLRSVSGGLLIQTRDHIQFDQAHCDVVTTRAPTAAEWASLAFAWRVVPFVKSNAIVYARDEMTVGIGTGQTSRVFSAQIACLKAQAEKLSLAGAVMASDAFFPFPDGVEVAAQSGITAVIQPGGSKRDAEIIDTANRLGLAMVLTHVRHFLH